MAVLVIDEQAERRVLDQIVVDLVEDLLPLVLVELQMMEEELGGDVRAAEGGEIEEALQAVRGLEVDVVEVLLERLEEAAGRQRLEVQPQALGPRRHPLVDVGGGAGEGEAEARVLPPGVEQPAAQRVVEQVGRRHVVDQLADEADAVDQRREHGAGVSRGAGLVPWQRRKQMPAGRPRVVEPQEERDQGGAGGGEGDARQERQHLTPQALPRLVVELPAFGDLDFGEAGEVAPLLVAVEVERQHPDLRAGTARRRCQQPPRPHPAGPARRRTGAAPSAASQPASAASACGACRSKMRSFSSGRGGWRSIVAVAVMRSPMKSQVLVPSVRRSAAGAVR